MTLNFTRNTQVTLFGNAATVDDLRVGEHQGQRVEADYDPSNNDARTFDVVQASLNEGEVGALLGQVLVGEIEGTIRAIDRSAVPPTLEIARASAPAVTLEVSPDVRILDLGEPATREELSPATPAKLRVDPSKVLVLEIETFTPRAGQVFLSGVVTSRLKGETVIITTLSGESVALRTPDTGIFELDGLTIPVGWCRSDTSFGRPRGTTLRL